MSLTINRSSLPLYVKAVTAYLNMDLDQFRVLHQNEELPTEARQLLQIRNLIRQRHWDQARLQLDTLTRSSVDFFKAEAHFLKAMVAFFAGQIEEAAIENMLALGFYQKCQDQRGQFFSLYNLSVDHARMGQHKVSAFYLELAKAQAMAADEKNLLYRAIACAESKAFELQKAVQSIEKALALQSDLTTLDLQGLYVVAADIYSRAGKFDHAEALLLKISQQTQKNNREYPRVQFELKLLEFLKKPKTLQVAPESFNHNEEYSLKWEVLRTLQSGQIEKAKAHWKSLRQILPQALNDSFTPVEKSDQLELFFQALQLILTASQVQPIAIESGGKLEELMTILKTSKTPLCKEEIIEQLWDIKYDPSFDSRFYKLIQRLRQQPGVKILSAHRAYRLG